MKFRTLFMSDFELLLFFNIESIVDVLLYLFERLYHNESMKG